MRCRHVHVRWSMCTKDKISLWDEIGQFCFEIQIIFRIGVPIFYEFGMTEHPFFDTRNHRYSYEECVGCRLSATTTIRVSDIECGHYVCPHQKYMVFPTHPRAHL